MKNKNKQGSGTVLGVLFGFVLLVGLILAYPIALYSSERVESITVEDRESVVGGGYLVFSENQEYQVSDSVLFWTFNSSRRYNTLDPGAEYECRVAGWRVPFLSMYPNIVEVIE